MREPQTQRGREVKGRIVASAAELFHTRGIEGTAVDQLLERSQAGKGQFYRYFDSKSDLTPEVLAFEVARWVARNKTELGELDSLDGIRRWCDAIVDHARRRQLARWCPIAALAGELVRDDGRARRPAAAEAFEHMASFLAAGLTRMQQDGRLRPDADPHRLALAFLACYEGGLLLAVTFGDVQPLRDSLDAAVNYLATFQ